MEIQNNKEIYTTKELVYAIESRIYEDPVDNQKIKFNQWPSPLKPKDKLDLWFDEIIMALTNKIESINSEKELNELWGKIDDTFIWNDVLWQSRVRDFSYIKDAISSRIIELKNKEIEKLQRELKISQSIFDVQKAIQTTRENN